MGLHVPFAPNLLVFFFFVTVTIYLERPKPIKLIKKKQTNKQTKQTNKTNFRPSDAGMYDMFHRLTLFT